MKIKRTPPQDIDEYVAGFPSNVQQRLKKIRAATGKAAPDAEETIKYLMPTFTLNGNLVHFAAFKNHIGFYPAPREVAEFKKELSAYGGTKSSLSLPPGSANPFRIDHQTCEIPGKEKPGRGRS